ncbi:MAG: hypothetical protein R2854_19525 [Caldilineaceae bacterium]
MTAIAHDYPLYLADDEVLGIAYRERPNRSPMIVILRRELIFRRRLDHAGVLRSLSEAIPVKEAWLDYLLTHHVVKISAHFRLSPTAVSGYGACVIQTFLPATKTAEALRTSALPAPTKARCLGWRTVVYCA